LDRIGELGQPGRPHVREQAQDPGVDLVTQPEPRRLLREQKRASEGDDREQDPGRGGDRNRMRQRPRGTGRAALAGGPLSRRICGKAEADGGALCLLAHGTPCLPGIGDCRAQSRLIKSCANPAYSGTSWTRSFTRAVSTSSQVPRFGRIWSGKLFAASV